MAFQKVLKVPKGILKGIEGVRFLLEEDLKDLISKKHELLFFLETRRYYFLDDYPFMGSFERRLGSSRIEGPFETTPKIKEQIARGYLESEKNVLELLVPSNIMPVTFQAVTYASYGTVIDENSRRYLGSVSGDRINPDKIWEIGNRILEDLHKRGAKIEQPNDSCYTTTLENCLIRFSLAKSNPYPWVEMAIFGRGETPLQLMGELGVYKISEQFHSNKDIGIKSTTKRGLSYNLSLNGKSISDVLNSENVVI